MLPTDRSVWMKAVTFSTEYSLLPNDAIHAATCNIHNMEHMATNDSDFERVSFLCIWKPEKSEE
jgi:predicted nucleic acid-binding protein